MNRFLEGKVAIVTGGTRGIGRAIAARLAGAGARVAICGRSEESVKASAEALSVQTGGVVIGKGADVSSIEDVEGLFQVVDKEFAGVDILVNNAGIGRFRAVAELSVEDWKRTLETNLSGVFYASRQALARFRERGGGFIINIGSLAGKNAMAGGAAYNASKFALNGFAEAMMLDHRHDNVRVCTIMPGSVATEFSPRGAGGADWMIAPDDIAEVVLMVLRVPERTMVSAVEIRPSKPRK